MKLFLCMGWAALVASACGGGTAGPGTSSGTTGTLTAAGASTSSTAGQRSNTQGATGTTGSTTSAGATSSTGSAGRSSSGRGLSSGTGTGTSTSGGSSSTSTTGHRTGSGAGSSTTSSGTTSTTGSTAAGRFTVANAQIRAPDGSTFVGKGINVTDWAAVQAGDGTANGTALLQLMPGVNLVRLNCQYTSEGSPGLSWDASGYNDDPANFATFVANLTAAQVVVEIEDHQGTNTIPTGSTYTAQLQWYADVASYYADNPYVWLGTMNEPWANPTATVMQQELDIYGAIRGTGNTAPVLLEISTPPDAWTTDWNGQESYFAGMTNVVWDVHIYDVLSGHPASQASVSASVVSQLAAVQQGTGITSQDGILPVVMGEYGPSITGNSVDVNGTQTVLGVQAAASSGCAAWDWSVSPGDDATNAGALTDYGTELVEFFAGTPPESWTFSDLP